MRGAAQAMREVFRSPVAVVLASVVAGVLFTAAVLLSNVRLVWQIVWSSNIAVIDKAEVIVNLLGSLGTNFTILGATSVVVIAVLFGINIAMFVHFVRIRRDVLVGGGAATSVGGLLSGVLGIGCAACGSVVLSAILPLVGIGGLLAVLPFGGEEFGLLGIGLLVVSVSSVAQKIVDPAVCIDPSMR